MSDVIVVRVDPAHRSAVSEALRAQAATRGRVVAELTVEVLEAVASGDMTPADASASAARLRDLSSGRVALLALADDLDRAVPVAVDPAPGPAQVLAPAAAAPLRFDGIAGVRPLEWPPAYGAPPAPFGYAPGMPPPSPPAPPPGPAPAGPTPGEFLAGAFGLEPDEPEAPPTSEVNHAPRP